MGGNSGSSVISKINKGVLTDLLKTKDEGGIVTVLKVTLSPNAPKDTDGVDGDLWFQYEE